MRILNGSDSDQWLGIVKDVLTTVSKCINGERYMEAAQLVFAVIFKSIIINFFKIVLIVQQFIYYYAFRLFVKK